MDSSNRPPVWQGSRIRLISTADPHTELQPGTRGVVTGLDDLGTIFVDWDGGSQLGLIPGIDQYELIEEKK